MIGIGPSDTSLVGAQVSGETVKVEVGRDLLLQ
ncbi:hemagglutinin repeat-containing protein, partial [Yersinia pestis]|nr:hemagglutinin repeat-containing protein [Yersinia pestis subsp. pestis]